MRATPRFLSAAAGMAAATLATARADLPAAPVQAPSRAVQATRPAPLVPPELSREANAILAKYRMAVVMIEIVDRSGRMAKGTAFFTSPDGELVTNHHVLAILEADPLAKVKFLMGDGKIIRDFRVGRCEGGGKDLCLLKLNEYPQAHFKTRQALPREGEPVFLIGNPRGHAFTVAAGYFQGTSFHDNVSEVEVSIGLVGGMSGGPIITRNGNLVGVATRSIQRVLSLVPKNLQSESRKNLGISVREVDRFQEKIERFMDPVSYFSQQSGGG